MRLRLIMPTKRFCLKREADNYMSRRKYADNSYYHLPHKRRKAGGVAAVKPSRGIGASIRVRGVVQGVGFRPFVVRLAEAFALVGRVWNDADGVMIEVWGDEAAIEAFVGAMQRDPPPLARIRRVERYPLDAACAYDGFAIAASHDGKTCTGVVADAATCPACLNELFDQSDRHYRYPFTNCTHCGPRLSIIRRVPYDRKNTSMADFVMCPACEREYGDMHDRRFHAQPNACPVCGPEVWLERRDGERLAGDPITVLARHIREGAIVAIKGIGGFHLACDAQNVDAVTRLRERKRRYHKPFALMARDLGQIEASVVLSADEAALLDAVEAPVVIMDAKSDAAVADAVAPGQSTLGFMLPYSPLHHLLMRGLAGAIVFTSGNVSDEPQCIDNEEAKSRLSSIADIFLLHNREIVNRLDDSVCRMVDGEINLLRRARGYAPGSIELPPGLTAAEGILAMGSELKNSFCLIHHGELIVSQHMGDLKHPAVLEDYEKNLLLYRQLYDFTLDGIAVDMHPDYFSTRRGQQLAGETGAHLFAVQHHHAHIAAVMAEHGLEAGEQVLGIAMDGLGMGLHGALWGGEFMLASYAAFERVGSIQQAPLIGGIKAMLEPWRNSYAQLHAIGWRDLCERFKGVPPLEQLAAKPLPILDRMIEGWVNCPLASSAGRLFDAVAGVLGICSESNGFEGQAAMALEVLAAGAFEAERGHGYPVAIEHCDGLPRLLWKPMWLALLEDMQQGAATEQMAARFHHGLIAAVSQMAATLATGNGVEKIVLGGGVFQNRLLLSGLRGELTSRGFRVYAPTAYPANDGAISLGQAVVMAAQRV